MRTPHDPVKPPRKLLFAALGGTLLALVAAALGFTTSLKRPYASLVERGSGSVPESAPAPAPAPAPVESAPLPATVPSFPRFSPKGIRGAEPAQPGLVVVEGRALPGVAFHFQGTAQESRLALEEARSGEYDFLEPDGSPALVTLALPKAPVTPLDPGAPALEAFDARLDGALLVSFLDVDASLSLVSVSSYRALEEILTARDGERAPAALPLRLSEVEHTPLGSQEHFVAGHSVAHESYLSNAGVEEALDSWREDFRARGFAFRDAASPGSHMINGSEGFVEASFLATKGHESVFVRALSHDVARGGVLVSVIRQRPMTQSPWLRKPGASAILANLFNGTRALP